MWLTFFTRSFDSQADGGGGLAGRRLRRAFGGRARRGALARVPPDRRGSGRGGWHGGRGGGIGGARSRLLGGAPLPLFAALLALFVLAAPLLRRTSDSSVPHTWEGRTSAAAWRRLVRIKAGIGWAYDFFFYHTLHETSHKSVRAAPTDPDKPAFGSRKTPLASL